MQNKLHIGEKVLCLAKVANGQKNAQMRECVLLECLRNTPTRLTQTAHRCLLEELSNFFAELLHDEKMVHGIPVLQVEISLDIIDLILKYIHIKQFIPIPARHIIHFIAVIKKFRTPTLIDQSRDYLDRNMKESLFEPEFLEESRHSAEDVQSLFDALSDVRLCMVSINQLIHRIHKLMDSDHFNKSLIGTNFIARLEPQLNPDIQSVCNVSQDDFRRHRSFTRLVRDTEDVTVYIASGRVDGPCKLMEVVDGACKNLKCSDVWPIYDILFNLTVIREQQLFVVESYGVVVINSRTGSVVRTLYPPQGQSFRGVTTFKDNIFVWTREGDLYVIGGADNENELKKVIETKYLFDGENHKNIRVTKWNKDSLDLICFDAETTILRRLIFDANGEIISDADAYSSAKTQRILPIGTNGAEGILFIVSLENYNNLFLISIKTGTQKRRILLSSKCWLAVDAVKSGNMAFVTIITVKAQWQLLIVNLDTRDRTTIRLGSANDRVTLIPTIKHLCYDELREDCGEHTADLVSRL